MRLSWTRPLLRRWYPRPVSPIRRQPPAGRRIRPELEPLENRECTGPTPLGNPLSAPAPFFDTALMGFREEPAPRVVSTFSAAAPGGSLFANTNSLTRSSSRGPDGSGDAALAAANPPIPSRPTEAKAGSSVEILSFSNNPLDDPLSHLSLSPALGSALTSGFSPTSPLSPTASTAATPSGGAGVQANGANTHGLSSPSGGGESLLLAIASSDSKSSFLGGPGPLLGPGSAPTVTNPGNQTNAEGAIVSLQISASGQPGDSLLYGSSGLPAGLTIDAASGLIGGSLAYTDHETQGGQYTVTITAYDTTNNTSGSTTFTWTVTDVNLAPVLSAPGDQTNGVGDGVALSLGATDGDGDGLTYSATNLPAGLAINSSTGLITGMPTSTAAVDSPYAVTVTASDGPANASVSFNWTITHVLIDSPGDQTNLDGDAVSRQINAWNPYGGALTYSATGLPSGLGINTTTGLISGTVAATDSASSPYSVSVTASDGTYHATTTFNWTVTHLAVENPGDQTNAEGDAVSLQMVADINTTETLTYSATGLPSGLSINSTTGLISGTVANLDANLSPYSVTVSATAGTNTASQTFNWTITHILLTNPGSQINAQGDTVSLQVQASDPDNDTLTYGASSPPSGLSVNTSTGLISGTISSSAGTPYTVTVTAADATHTASQTFTWSVTNALATVTNPGTQSNAEGAAVSLTITASDAANDPLDFTAVGLPPGLGIDLASGVISGTIDYSAAETNGGVYHATVMADNGAGKTGSTTFTWNTTNVDQAPVVVNPGDQLNLTGDVVSLQAWAYDLDGDTLTYSATSLPTGLSINSSTGVISGTISGSGSYSATVSASDGTYSGSQTFNWQLTNGTVTVTQPASQSSAENDAVSLQISASSTYGYALTYSAHGLPTGLSINGTTGLISGTIAFTGAEDVPGGVYTVTVTASDSYGHSGATMFSWSVADPEQAPTLTNPGAQNNAEKNVVSLQIQATSPTGASLTYAASGLPAGLDIDPFTGLISGTVVYTAAETAGGHYTTLVSVNDGNGGTASQTFTWTITDTDRAPWLAYPGLQVNKVGDSVLLQPLAGDYDGDTLTFSAYGLPPGLSINTATGRITGTISPSTGGNVTLTASDGHLSTSQTFTWQVTFNSTAPKVVLAINNTVDPRDDLAFMNPGQPPEVISMQVTLSNASSGAHQIQLIQINNNPGGAVSLSGTSFSLVNGGTTTIMITPTVLSVAVDDVRLLAQADGNQAGDGKVTVASVTLAKGTATLPEKIRAKDTPEKMPDRIPPRVWSTFDYTLNPSPWAPSGKVVWLVKTGFSALNGDVQFKSANGEADAIYMNESGTFKIRGKAGKQTEQGNAGHLTVEIHDGDGNTLAKSAGFSVAAIPVKFLVSYGTEGISEFKGHELVNLQVKLSYDSDSGVIDPDLNQVFVSEAVEYVEDSGTFAKFKVTHVTSVYSANPISEPLPPDNHTTDTILLVKDGGVEVANQVFLFWDKRTGAKDLGIPKGTDDKTPTAGYTIKKDIEQDAKDGQWKVTTSLVGAAVSVTVKDAKNGPKAGTYESKAGATKPAIGMTTKPLR